MLITFEGIDGSGKSTQIKELKRYLQNEGYKTVTFREPGGTEASEKIRSLLLDDSLELNSVTELFLFSAARSQLIQEKVIPFLKDEYIVILDRFYDSTTAYQGYGRSVLSLEDIKHINQIASHCITPDLTFYLRIGLQEGRKRSGDLKDRMEQSDDAFYRRVIKGFDELARQHNRIITMDASKNKEIISDKIIETVRSSL